MDIAIEIRDGEVLVPHAAGPRLVQALNDCFEQLAQDELEAAGLTYKNQMTHRELLDFLRAE